MNIKNSIDWIFKFGTSTDMCWSVLFQDEEIAILTKQFQKLSSSQAIQNGFWDVFQIKLFLLTLFTSPLDFTTITISNR